MQELRASLLREKFIITEKGHEDDPIMALSNRIVIPLASDDGIDNETLIIRTQNMHSCARLAAALIKEFSEDGTIAHRAIPVPWNEIWGDVIKGYERDWNPNIWCAIYHQGQPLYTKGEHHPFIDIIEQCDSTNEGEYEKSIKFAETAFSDIGKKVSIKHQSNVALITSCKKDQAKCGIIIRAANGTTTFNYTATPLESSPKPIYAHTTLSVAASFLEAVQLSFLVGTLNKKRALNLIEKGSDEERKHNRVTTRLGNLNRAITKYEQDFDVNYRPERPKFQEMIDKAEAHASKTLKSELEDKIASGDKIADDWIM